MEEYISRPPFDQNGYAVYGKQSKKKKTTPLRWIIPAGLLAVVILIVVLIANRPKDPNTFCRQALKDAITDSFGSGDPLIREIGLNRIREDIISGNYAMNASVSVQSIEAKEGTGVYNLLDSFGWKPEDIPSGIGLGMAMEALDGQGAYEDLGIVFGGIRLILLKAWNDESNITLASSRLYSDALSFAFKELRNGWEENAGWSLLPEEKRESVKETLRTILNDYKLSSILARFTDGASPLHYFGKDFDEEYDRLLQNIRFSEAKNASGQRVQEKFHVGREKLLCYGYHAEIDTEEICRRIRTFASLSKEDLYCAEGSEVTEATLFLTRRGELISLSFDLELYVTKQYVPIHFTYYASGERDPQDHYVITIDTNIGKPVSFSLTKNTTKNAYSVRSQLEAAVNYEGNSYSASMQSSFDLSSETLTISANTAHNDGSVGGLEAEVKVNDGESYGMNFSKLKIWDTYTGTTFNLNCKFSINQKTDGFSAKPPKTVHNIMEMTEEEWKKVYEEIKEKVGDYMDYLGDMI